MSDGNKILLFIICLLLISVASFGDEAACILQYERTPVLHGEVWRIFTAHLTHINRNHLSLNIVGIIFIFLLWGDLLTPWKWVAASACCMLGISLGHVLFSPQLNWYRGFSGVLHGLVILGVLREIQGGNKWYRIVLVAVIAKILSEQTLGPMSMTHQFINAPVVPSAHLWGAISGGAVAYFFSGKRDCIYFTNLPSLKKSFRRAMMKATGMYRGWVVMTLLMALLLAPVPALADDEVRLSAGQTVYVPAYSHIYVGNREQPFLLTVTLSIRNVDANHPFIVTTVDYYETQGKLLRRYLAKPVALKPFESMRYVVPQKDKSGGSGANFVVKWKADAPVNQPLIEAIMIGAEQQQGISFTSRGQVITTAN